MKPGAQRGGGRVVLYVEDDECDRFFMGRAFTRTREDLVLQMVGDGSAAIDYLRGTGVYADRQTYPMPDLVLLDVSLPVLSGFDVLKWLRASETYRQMPVVVFSSSSLPRDREVAARLGADEYWEKPSSGDVYGQVVQRLWERLSSGREIPPPVAWPVGAPCGPRPVLSCTPSS